VGTPRLGEGLVDLDESPSPALQSLRRSSRDRIGVVPERGPQLDLACDAALLDGHDPERPQRVGGELGVVDGGRDHERKH
jgi:hypothetical protein